MELFGVYYTILDTGGLGADGFTVTNNSGFTFTKATSNGREYYFYEETITDHTARGFTIETGFDIITGDAFEEKGLDYANYRVVLTGTLMKEVKNNGVSTTPPTYSADTDSYAFDYIVYTNARIRTDFVKAN